MGPIAMKPILEVGVLDVEDLQVVDTRLEEPSSLPERDAVLLLVEQVLGISHSKRTGRKVSH